MRLSSIHDGAEAQFVQYSTALFEFSGTARIISAPSSQGHGHSPLLRTGDSAALINPLQPSLKIVHRWITFCTEGQEGPDYKVCLRVVRDPRSKVCTLIVAQKGIAASSFASCWCHIAHSVCHTINAHWTSYVEPWVTMARSLA